ncbi:uncharacterized protein KD926_010218 [Aspergillus affinis]|uniref:uncharacterized protein n=1 Tax=Aspergillus affinis TaxID=1070780 RepID=UPI0022FF19EB|nr:uncharacterized protein KD926_010218 [Aspergillus affinis]KAI9038885.1 hypothetical protein KD926_010218 [Aspergillus affinis]
MPPRSHKGRRELYIATPKMVNGPDVLTALVHWQDRLQFITYSPPAAVTTPKIARDLPIAPSQKYEQVFFFAVEVSPILLSAFFINSLGDLIHDHPLTQEAISVLGGFYACCNGNVISLSNSEKNAIHTKWLKLRHATLSELQEPQSDRFDEEDIDIEVASRLEALGSRTNCLQEVNHDLHQQVEDQMLEYFIEDLEMWAKLQYWIVSWTSDKQTDSLSISYDTSSYSQLRGLELTNIASRFQRDLIATIHFHSRSSIATSMLPLYHCVNVDISRMFCDTNWCL